MSTLDCKLCGKFKKVQLCFFKQNVSYVYERREKTFCGYLCFTCMTKIYFNFTIKTLFGTWWGLIGAFLGPVYIMNNTIEYLKNSFKFLLKK